MTQKRAIRGGSKLAVLIYVLALSLVMSTAAYLTASVSAEPEIVRARKRPNRVERVEKAEQPPEVVQPTLLPVAEPERPSIYPQTGECCWTFLEAGGTAATTREYREGIIIAGPCDRVVNGAPLPDLYLIRLMTPSGTPSLLVVLRSRTEMFFRHTRDAGPNQKTDWQ